MTQLSHVVSSRVMWLSMRARSPSARSPSTRRCASTPLGPIGPRSRAERCPLPTTPTVLAFSNRRPWSATVGGTFCPVSSQGGFGRIDAQSDRCRSRGRAYGPERLGGTVRPGVVPAIDSFRVHALSPQASLAYPSGPVRGTGRSESQRRRADTRGCTLDSAAHVKPEHAAGAARPWLSVEQPTVHTDRPGGRTPSAICPWTPRHAGPQRNKVTHAGIEKKRPASPKLLGCGAPTTALTWAFASSKVVSSGYGLTSANFHHGSRAWSRIFCAEKPCPLRRSRRSGRRYLHIVTVTSG